MAIAAVTVDPISMRDKRVVELASLVEQRKMLDHQIEAVIAKGFGTWSSVAEEMAAVLGISRASFYRRYGHLNHQAGSRW